MVVAMVVDLEEEATVRAITVEDMVAELVDTELGTEEQQL